MAERMIVFQDKVLEFDGLFDMKGLFQTIFHWFWQKNYDMMERKNYEYVYDDGKKIFFELIPYKKTTDYHKMEMKVRATFEKLKEVEIEIKGVKHKLLKGKAHILFDATLITDYENRWEGRPIFFFFRSLIDKFIYKDYTDAYMNELVRDAKELEEEIKSYLNMFRYVV